MASKTQKQLVVLGVLVGALVVVTTMRGGEDPPAGSQPPPSNSVSGTTGTRQPPQGTRQQAQQAAGQAAVADVQLEALTAPRDDAPEPERNLFRFEVKARPPAPPGPRAAEPPPRTVPTGPPVPAGPAPPPPIPLRFIGVLNAPTQAGRVAILADGRGNTFQGREGDIIEGRYRLMRIGPDNVEMVYADGRGRQVIRLTGQ
jgi:hypothetical protein